MEENLISVKTRSEDDIVNDILGNSQTKSNSAESDNDDEIIDSTDLDLPKSDDGAKSIHTLRR